MKSPASGWGNPQHSGRPLKDPSTGLGIGDALTQSFMLAESLSSWFDGADWDATMSTFQQKRDQAMKPTYEATLNHTRMRDMGPAEQNLLKAVFLSPSTTRAMAHNMVAQLPSLLSPAAHGQTAYISKMFPTAPQPTKS